MSYFLVHQICVFLEANMLSSDFNRYKNNFLTVKEFQKEKIDKQAGTNLYNIVKPFTRNVIKFWKSV